ncbi:unnamed protein product [Bemisia tabaci]|uniref:Uncharacterized protein n=1 Tax=Bemisia tabaci TaxID=7038 RepID=A0A9P0FA99_BEMTA|nr:unnamed protein product [Bemisia tabaci]
MNFCDLIYRSVILSGAVLLIFAKPNSANIQKTEIGFTKINSLYNANLLEPGHILISNVDNIHLMGRGWIFKFPHTVCPFAYDVEFHAFKLPLDRKYDQNLMVKIIGTAPYPERSIALAERLAWKHVPHHPWYCRRGDYWRYILHGERPRPAIKRLMMKSCPLAMPVGDLTPDYIRSEEFQFLDFNGRWNGVLELRATGRSRFCLLGKAFRYYQRPQRRSTLKLPLEEILIV